MSELTRRLQALFSPESVAVIGASSRPDSPGTMLLRAIEDMRFRGELFPINPRHEEILGHRCFPSLSAIGRHVDLAILAIPPESVPDAVRECAEAGVSNCIITSAGFSETGTDRGKLLEEQVLDAVAGSDMRLVGPNCLGIYSSTGGLALFGGQTPSGGRVSVISQSGSIASMLYMLCAERAVMFSKMVSSGNELDLDCADYLEYFAQDPETDIVICYLEQVREARRFMRTAEKLRGAKPLLVWRAGLTPTGSRAAASHTAALSGSSQVWDAARKQADMVEIEDLADATDVLAAFYHLPAPLQGGACVISPPGGIGVNSADAAEKNGVHLPPLAADTIEALAGVLPPVGTGLSNPVDMGFGAVVPGNLGSVMKIVARDPAVDVLVVVAGAPAFRKGDPGLIKMHTAEIKEAAADLDKPVMVLGIPSGFAYRYMAELSWAGIPCYLSPSAAFRALARFQRYWRDA